MRSLDHVPAAGADRDHAHEKDPCKGQGLAHILEHGGSGYFLEKSVAPMLADGRLFRVKDAPVFHRPTYLVYPDSPVDEKLAATAIRGLKQVAGGPAERA